MMPKMRIQNQKTSGSSCSTLRGRRLETDTPTSRTARCRTSVNSNRSHAADVISDAEDRHRWKVRRRVINSKLP
jgi:hypothetical protein